MSENAARTRRPQSDGPLAAVTGGDLMVPLVQGGTARYANLDYAASAPALQSVADRLAAVLPYYSSVHRGAGYPSLVSTLGYESARATVARFVGAREDDVTVFTRNTTDSMNLLAACVPPGEEVVGLDIEHHANLLPWRGRRWVRSRDSLADTLRALDEELGRRPVALLAVTGASNVTGELLPLDVIVDIAHSHGTRVAVDAAQLAPHRRIDLGASGIDYLAFSGHKLYAPYGSGVLVGRRDWLDEASPYLAGGGAVVEVGLERTEWAAAPQRHEAGTPNVLGAIALAAACDAIRELPEGAVGEHEARLRETLLAGLGGCPEVRVHRIWGDTADAIAVVTFSVDGYDPSAVASYLSCEHGIGVRDGRFCAHPLAAHLGLPASGAVRASVGLGSAAEDVERLIDAVRHLVKHGPAWNYRRVHGRWEPDPDPRPLPSWARLPQGGQTAAAAAVGASPCVAASAL